MGNYFKYSHQSGNMICDVLIPFFLDQSHIILGVRECLVTNVDQFYLFDHYTYQSQYEI